MTIEKRTEGLHISGVVDRIASSIDIKTSADVTTVKNVTVFTLHGVSMGRIFEIKTTPLSTLGATLMLTKPGDEVSFDFNGSMISNFENVDKKFVFAYESDLVKQTNEELGL